MPTAPTISPREREVLLAVADRLTNAEIAERLYVSVRTVESHVSTLLRKLAARDRRELAARAPGLAGPPAGLVVGAPRPPTSFVGRAAERDAVVRLVAGSRVTTVLGPGGMGKTRLAVAATEAASPLFPDGTTFVNLLPSRPGSVLESVAAGLGVRPRPQQPLSDAVTAQLAGRALLVLDNCEHVADDVADVITALTAASPRLSVLTTSRERLGVPGETVLHLGPLPAAADLFTERAKAVDPAFDADPAKVAALCRALGGSPLNIELAAARVASLGIDALHTGLADDPLRVLSAGRGQDRHRSLRSVLEWSHRLLSAEERTLLARISRFRNGFALGDVAALSPDLSVGAVSDLLGRLVDKSLVTAHREAGTWTLFDGVARFARERLDGSPEAAEVTARYRRWAAHRARELTTRLGGDWRDEFDRIADDLRTCVTEGGTACGEHRHDQHGRLADTRATADHDHPHASVAGTPDHPHPHAPVADTPDHPHPHAPVADTRAIADHSRPRAPAAHTHATSDHHPHASVADTRAAPNHPHPHAPAAGTRATAELDHDLAANLARLAYARGFLAEAVTHWRTAADRAPSAAVAAGDLARAGSGTHLLTHARDHFDLLLVAAGRAAGDPATRAVCLAGAVVLAERFRGAGFVTDPVPEPELDRLLAEATEAATRAPAAAASVAVARAWRSGPGPQSVDAEAAGRAVAAASGDPLLLSAALDAQCTAQALAGRPDRAYRTTQERLALVTTLDRTDPHAAVEVLDAFRAAITYAVATGELSGALALSRRAAGDPALAGHPYWGTSGLVTALALTGRFAEARTAADELWHTTAETGPPRNATLGVPLLAAALAAGLSGDEPSMAEWRTRAAAVAGVATPAESANLAPLDAFVRARVALHTGTGLAGLLPEVGTAFTPGRFDGYAAGLAAELAVALNAPDISHHIARAERHAAHNRWTAAALTRAHARRQGDAGLLKDAAKQFTELGAAFEAEAT
ncbi:LuxR C-terminal-related transcriptional regulator [Amycolatopsis sp. A133]|uniref:ATP-binding protein n=1 Tax=Amycolatopsis sp. A133 TaxID=3064472 RepID=UPI0027ED92EF|nr:LuxR C-terminal-related transcriptional regulator [Amycolatopsis sp. A133]MDQ7805500.1 LuxR C-terminal-related transcriptional regulator [Amycolatopsis sp. A133]